MKRGVKNFKSSQKIWKIERVNVDVKIKLQYFAAICENYPENPSTI